MVIGQLIIGSVIGCAISKASEALWDTVIINTISRAIFYWTAY